MTPVEKNSAPLCIHYHDASDPAAAPDEQTLAVVSYGQSSSIDTLDERRITVGLPILHGVKAQEVWRSNQPVEAGWSGDISYRCTETVLFGQLLLDDAEHGGIQGLMLHVYHQILTLQERMNYPNMLRIWNYFPAINQHEHGQERYRSFCVGRHQAIDTSSGYERHLPSASAIGTHGGRTLVYFLAARAPGRQIENPRQVSAFEYPPSYSPRSPAFSRAVLMRWSENKHLYISGTASIIGHETHHRHDYIRQLDECLNNIDALISKAREEMDLDILSAADLSGIKVYLRHTEYLEHTMNYISDRLGDGTAVVYLHGDICRRDLLLEVEGLYSSC